MASIVYQVDKKTGAKYAFESVSYWDKDKKQPRSKRKYLGKVDPETGDIIPSRGRSCHNEENNSLDAEEMEALHNEIREKDKTIEELRREIEDLTAKNKELLSIVKQIRVMVEPF